MKRTSSRAVAATYAGALALALAIPGVMAADSRIENLGETFYSDPNQYQFDSESDEENLTFDEEKRLRICLGTDQDLVPLELEYNGNKETVDPGECTQFKTREVTVRPAKEVPARTSIVWTYEEEQQE